MGACVGCISMRTIAACAFVAYMFWLAKLFVTRRRFEHTSLLGNTSNLFNLFVIAMVYDKKRKT